MIANHSATSSANSVQTIWIVDDDRSIRWVLEKALEKEGLNVRTFDSGDAALKQLTTDKPVAIVSDVRMPGIDGLGLLGILQKDFPEIPVIIMTAHSDLDSAVSAYQGGAFEYLPKPFDVDEAVAVTRRALAHAQEISSQYKEPEPILDGEIIGEAPAMQEVFRAIGRLSQSNITVLINGESGTGKELVAHALHRHSPRKQNRFVALNMAAIPRDLIESELFGHEKGANLETLVEKNEFREDLFHRLNVIRIHIPRLEDRREDIPRLAQFFFSKAAKDLDVEPKVLLPKTEEYLCSLAWPGNVRQLENTCRWITVMGSGREVLVEDLPPELMEKQEANTPAGDWEKSLRSWADQALARGQTNILEQATPAFETALIEIALKHTSGRKRDAADLLGWGRNTLTRKLKELEIHTGKSSED